MEAMARFCKLDVMYGPRISAYIDIEGSSEPPRCDGKCVAAEVMAAAIGASSSMVPSGMEGKGSSFYSSQYFPKYKGVHVRCSRFVR
jgi:hypothetical protein